MTEQRSREMRGELVRLMKVTSVRNLTPEESAQVESIKQDERFLA